ncbi:MAG: hypothetical protein J1F33_05715 [Clostridiales bacterium]|nr:hypothetical protein [Clostridiales bacterium]
MEELNAAAEQTKLLFGTTDEAPVSGDWAQWYHEGIPDGPEDVREDKRRKAATEGHCLDCTTMSGCYFIDGEKTFPKYPHHDNCHCKKIRKNPTAVEAGFLSNKFRDYVFNEEYSGNGKEKRFENIYGYNINDSDFLLSEYKRQAKEKYISGDYTLGLLNTYGQRITIEIVLNTPYRGRVAVKTGWMVRPNGLITCNTPFSGDDYTKRK